MDDKRILLVDDEPHIVRLMKMQLEREGYVVDAAFNGEQAVEKLRRSMPHVVITDIQMPRMDGKALCQHILQGWPDRHPLILIATSRTELEHREWSRAFPQVSFLEKPVSMRKLIERLAGHFSERAEATTP